MQELRNILSTGLSECHHMGSYCKFIVNKDGHSCCIKNNDLQDIKSIYSCRYANCRKRKR
jgi:hypothetical protein